MILFPIKNGKIVQGYGENVEFYKQRFGLTGGHNGIDIVSFHGDDLLCAEDGFVYKIYNISSGSVTKGFGVCILTNPNENGIVTEWVYWHTMSNIQVKEEDKVKQGQLLAFEGDSGYVYTNGQPVPDSQKGIPPYPGTHLHWGKRFCKKTLNPTGIVLAINEFSVGTVPELLSYKDNDGYYYEILNINNGCYGFVNPMSDGNPPLNYDAWMANQEFEKTEAIISGPISSEEKQKVIMKTQITILGYIISLLKKVKNLLFN